MNQAERMSSITEATGSLVEILDSLENSGGDSGAAKTTDLMDFFAFNNKDLIIYALGGMTTLESPVKHSTLMASAFDFQLVQPSKIPSICVFSMKIIQILHHCQHTLLCLV